jgi:hypothetical protein
VLVINTRLFCNVRLAIRNTNPELSRQL